MNVNDSGQQEIIRALKRCSEETVAAAIRFHETRDPSAVPVVVYGILERDRVGESTVRLADAPGNSRLIEDIGMDSLGLMEAVMTVEEVLGISIQNSELRQIGTLDDLNNFIREKLGITK